MPRQHCGSFFKEHEIYSKWMVQRKNCNLHLTKRKNSDDRFKDDHTEASGRATQHAQATWVICVHTKMNLPLFPSAKSHSSLIKKNTTNRNISSWNIPWMCSRYLGRLYWHLKKMIYVQEAYLYDTKDTRLPAKLWRWQSCITLLLSLDNPCLCCLATGSHGS